MAWTNFTDSLIGAAAQGLALGTGQANTAAIVGQTIDNQHCVLGAAYICDNLVVGEYTDWYLPSKDELHKLYLMYLQVGEDSGFNPSGYYQLYWSSSESAGQFDLVLAWRQYFDNDPGPDDDPPEHRLQVADMLGAGRALLLATALARRRVADAARPAEHRDHCCVWTSTVHALSLVGVTSST